MEQPKVCLLCPEEDVISIHVPVKWTEVKRGLPKLIKSSKKRNDDVWKSINHLTSISVQFTNTVVICTQTGVVLSLPTKLR